MKDPLMLSLKKVNQYYYQSDFSFPPIYKFKIFQDYSNLLVKNQEPIYRDKVKQIIGEEEFEY